MFSNEYRRAKFWLTISISTFALGAIVALVRTEGIHASAPTTNLAAVGSVHESALAKLSVGQAMPGRQDSVLDTFTATLTPTRTSTPTASPTEMCPGSVVSRAPYPVLVRDHVVVSLGGMLYSFSGVVNGTVSGNSYKYDRSSDTWTAIAPLTSPRRNASAVTDGTYIYILAGSDVSGTVTNTLVRYDPGSNTYLSRASAPTATEKQAAVYKDGKIYKIAGATASGLTNAIETYDITSNTWTSLLTSPGGIPGYPYAVAGLQAAVIGDYIYGAGGITGYSMGVSTGTPTPTDATWGFNLAVTPASTWDDPIIEDLPAARRAEVSGLLKGMWFVAGGEAVNTNHELKPDGQAYKWIPPTPGSGGNEWKDVGTIQTAVAGASGATMDIHFQIVGGQYVFIATPLPGTPTPDPSAGSNSNSEYTDSCQLGNGIFHMIHDDGNKDDTMYLGQCTTQTPTPTMLLKGRINDSVQMTQCTTQTAALWLNRFDGVPPSYPITITSIYVYWPDQQPGPIIGLPIKLLVYQDIDSDNNPANATLRSEISATVGITGAFQEYPVNVPITSTGDLYIGFEDFWAEPGYVPALNPAAIDRNSSRSRSWVIANTSGAPPDRNDLGNNDLRQILDTLNSPGNWMIRARASYPTGIVNGHLAWQGVTPTNMPSVTGTLTLCVAGTPQDYNFTTDTVGNFTVTTGLLDGTYHWKVKGGRHITTSSTADGGNVTISGSHASQEFGMQKGGNTNTDNLVNAGDFTNLRNQFGQGGIRSADADYNLVVNSSDFTILKSNFGQAGHNLTCP